MQRKRFRYGVDKALVSVVFLLLFFRRKDNRRHVFGLRGLAYYTFSANHFQQV